MANPSDQITGAGQLAALRAQRAGEGFSRDPADYRPLRIKLSGSEFNDLDPKYRPELDPKGFLIGENIIGPEGVPVIVLGSLSGCRESDRFIENGRQTTRPYALWAKQPEVTYITGKGGGKKTRRGGWIDCWHDEIFAHTPYGLGVLTLYDAHDVVARLNQLAQSLDVGAMCEAKWQLTKEPFPDGDYTKYKPHFELLGVAGEPNGSSDRELAQAKKLSALVAKISYQSPGNGEPMDEPPAPHPDDPGPDPDDDFLRTYRSKPSAETKSGAVDRSLPGFPWAFLWFLEALRPRPRRQPQRSHLKSNEKGPRGRIRGRKFFDKGRRPRPPLTKRENRMSRKTNLPDGPRKGQGKPRKPTDRGHAKPKPSSAGSCGPQLLALELLNDDSQRFAKLRAQAEADLVETVKEAEARLDKLIRGSFFAIDGGRR